MDAAAKIKAFLPVSSRSAHAMHREIGEIHRELNELRETVDALQLEIMGNHEVEKLLMWGAITREGEDALSAKKRFFREMAPASGLLRLRQEATLKLLEGFMSFCADNEIEYWIAQGSLLGAVRHGGYIPWDDDLDVGMTRQNLKRAQSAIEGNEKFRITERFDYCVTCRQIRFCYADPAIPLFIDIFVFDPVSHIDTAALEMREAARLKLVDMLSSNQALSYWNLEEQFIDSSDPRSVPIASLFDDINSGLYECGAYASDDERADGYIWAIDNVDSGVENHGWYLIPREVLLPLKTIEFEGHTVLAPRDPETFLESYFEDFYDFPDLLGTYYTHQEVGELSQAELIRMFQSIIVS